MKKSNKRWKRRAVAMVMGTSLFVSQAQTSIYAEEAGGDGGTMLLAHGEGRALESPLGLSTATGARPADGTTEGNPFRKGTGGSASFRIPALVTLEDGTLVAAADARWNTTYDGGGLDTIVSRSTDYGANWSYTFANYLGDNGNQYNGVASTTFIDPELATDGETLYMLCDIYPYGVALNGNKDIAPERVSGFQNNGKLALKRDGESGFDYYLDGNKIKKLADDSEVEGYTVDPWFYITGNGADSNLFFEGAPFQVMRTSYLYFTSSTDSGRTWSAPKLINVKTSREMAYLAAPGRGVVTGDGKIVFSCYGYDGSEASQQMDFICSSDGGDTWSRVAGATSTWSSESSAVELDDGTLRFFYRNGNETLHYIDYKDGAWKQEVNTQIPTNSNCQISAVKYSQTAEGKQVLLVSCPTGPDGNGSSSSTGGPSAEGGARLNGKIFVGLVNADNSMDWRDDAHIQVNADNAEYMYSCLTEMANGKIALLYEDHQSGWGTGDDKYYTMDFQTYDLNLHFDVRPNGTN